MCAPCTCSHIFVGARCRVLRKRAATCAAHATSDVNAFWNDHDEPHTAELEVMVAEPGCRRRGLASEALRLFMAWCVGSQGVTRFRVKIGEANAASLALFGGKLGFAEVSRSAVFREVTLELAVEGDVADRLAADAAALVTRPYDGSDDDGGDS